MSRINKAFAGGKAFIAFVTAGDPNINITEQLILAIENAGADLIEIGIPFSDPVAEGIVIQKADERALASGTTTDQIFDMVKRVRTKTDIPLALMTYFNPVYVYGIEKFVKCSADCGVDAIIVPDLPFEEKNELQPICKKNNIDLISLIAPTSNERITKIASEAEGFLYCVSSLGVTGVRSEFSSDIKEMVSLVKSVKDIPCAVGFGISAPEHAKAMVQFADGVIVGSAIVKIIEQYSENCIEPVSSFVKQMKSAI
ncbi:MAG TPA: tryptophan synthase subunit alpha, partial [Ruminococcaceae bacterium]|nr:tryptophan synthase subunit alpha [Oscillospiraceae bacterium]